jgi:hypothetical protein
VEPDADGLFRGALYELDMGDVASEGARKNCEPVPFYNYKGWLRGIDPKKLKSSGGLEGLNHLYP